MSDSIGSEWVYCPVCDDTLLALIPEDEATPLECCECGNEVEQAFSDERKELFNEDLI